jgi:hypothetical protein
MVRAALHHEIQVSGGRQEGDYFFVVAPTPAVKRLFSSPHLEFYLQNGTLVEPGGLGYT